MHSTKQRLHYYKFKYNTYVLGILSVQLVLEMCSVQPVKLSDEVVPNISRKKLKEA